MSDYSEMLSKMNEIINELSNHECGHEHCCVKSLLAEIEFND
jgi:hypothetical protein